MQGSHALRYAPAAEVRAGAKIQQCLRLITLCLRPTQHQIVRRVLWRIPAASREGCARPGQQARAPARPVAFPGRDLCEVEAVQGNADVATRAGVVFVSNATDTYSSVYHVVRGA